MHQCVARQTTTFAEVRKHGDFVRALLDGAGELRGRHQREIQLARQALERARDVGDLLDAVIVADLGGHQLEIIDEGHIQAALGGQAATFGAQLEHGDGGRVVDVDGQLGKVANRVGELRPFVIAQATQAQALRIDVADLGDHPLHQLLRRHLQAEERDGAPFLRGLQREGDHQRGLAHARSRGQDQQIGALEAAQHPVDIAEAAGNAQRFAAMLVEIFDPVVITLYHLLHRLEFSSAAPLRDAEERLLGAVDDLVDGHRLVVGVASDVADGIQQAPAHGGLLDHAAIGFDVDRGRDGVHQFGDVRGAADGLQLVVIFQLGVDG